MANTISVLIDRERYDMIKALAQAGNRPISAQMRIVIDAGLAKKERK